MVVMTFDIDLTQNLVLCGVGDGGSVSMLVYSRFLVNEKLSS
jgi:hypothetical protein